MIKIPVRLNTFVLAAMVSSAAVSISHAQISGDTSARNIPNEVERADPRIAAKIEAAEKHFKAGEACMLGNKRADARDQFDRAVDTVLGSGLDVRSYPRLQKFYLELIERVYRIEVPQQTAARTLAPTAVVTGAGVGSASDTVVTLLQIGFSQQEYVPAAQDELAKLVFTEQEKMVSDEQINDLALASGSVNFKYTPNVLIQQFINFYQGRGRTTMENGLRRSGQFMRMARKIFREEGVPEDVVWLGQVESAWIPKARSWASAAGLWQFVPDTGARFGLRQTAYVDERHSFEQATRASAKYLKFLANRYNGNWELAMGAYNTGEGNVDRAISRAGVSDFWSIYPYIPQETRNYVPNILAVILISKNPAKYGFNGVKPDAPIAYDVVQVPTATSLKLIASITDSSEDYLRTINPELRKGTTPREPYNVRVPAGRAKQFVASLKQIPIDKRESGNAALVTVAKGDDWQTLANRSGFTVDQLQASNPGFDIKSGGKLYMPRSNVQLTSIVRAKQPDNNKLRTINALKGDTIAKIAARYDVPAADLARMNGVKPNDSLASGRVINLPAAAATHQAARPAAQSRRRR